VCRECWERGGSPANDSPEIARAVELIGDLYDINAAGGPLHVYVDDWNLEGEIVPWDGYDYEYDPPEMRAIVAELAALLNAMTIDDRYSTLARARGFVVDQPA